MIESVQSPYGLSPARTNNELPLPNVFLSDFIFTHMIRFNNRKTNCPFDRKVRARVHLESKQHMEVYDDAISAFKIWRVKSLR